MEAIHRAQSRPAGSKSTGLRSKKLTVYVLFTLPALLLYIGFFFYPTLMGFNYSLTNWDGMARTYRYIGLDNYAAIFRDSRFLHALQFTFKYTLIVVIVKTAIALGLAMLLTSGIRMRGFFRSIYFFPAVLSLITIGLIFNEIFFTILPKLGESLGIEVLSRNILGNKDTALYGILIANVWHGVSVPMVIFMAGLSSVPKDLHEAATIDGASRTQRFFSITFPFLIPMLNVNLVLLIKGGLTVFDSIVAMTDGGPGTSTESIGFLIYRHGLLENKFGYATAESIFIFALIGLISFIQMKWLGKKEVGQQ
ncbi:sugar ABC transporter permease [Paenibacillus doosanensis]|uniref:L-arabinose transport system permease protein AraP n=1 Tax=Paenibacillus konkukensis TaxID=2020716 RepID=A0ABY4RJ31_9BACL|nr:MULTISPECIES: sugar ABC transporter permease [Paenibacillus]MCS7463993.1 sugar ABC transporter permease [Paenibacillus doosanensis]UQZ81412.1 L-arabinose transport system permease protein AraP [Paenibacillus konkukensis]